MKTKVVVTLLFLLMVAAVGCSRRETPPAPTSSVPLFEGLGEHHMPVTTSNTAAQQYFDQGIRLVYGFNHDEAERSFREAARLDPNCAMAWWGVAYALGPNINLPLDAERNTRALDAVSRARALLSHASPKERDYIETVTLRYSADPGADRAQLDKVFSNAMGTLSEKYPDDLDAATLYAESMMNLKPWRYWTADGKPQEGTEHILQVLESVLARNPQHPGANHYYIHAVEASPHPEKALQSAERLKTLVPSAGHLVHMPAHIQIRIGDYAGASESNMKAAKADEAYIARTNAQGVYPLMYYTHNYMFLATAQAMMGQTQQSVESAKKAVSIAAPMGSDPMAEYVNPWELYVLCRGEKWDAILAYPEPAASNKSTRAMWHYARTLAQAGKGNLSEARRERQAFEVATAAVPKDFMLSTNMAHDLLSIASHVLDARIASKSGNAAAAIKSWMAAVEVQDRLVYDEPPAWYYPVRESLGGEYLRAKNFPEAEKVFRRDLEINPNNARSLLGLAEALQGQAKRAEADEARQRFEASWKNADIQLSIASL
jgi:tetratricopeptide (TPR) repeat protein